MSMCRKVKMKSLQITRVVSLVKMVQSVHAYYQVYPVLLTSLALEVFSTLAPVSVTK